MSLVVASAHPGNTAGIRPTVPSKECKSEKCEIRLNIGIFFDGTGNNQDWVENASVNWRKGLVNWWNKKKSNTKTQLQQQADSNVARLFRAYRNDPIEGYFRIYVPGVGTPFKDIGEEKPASLGAAFGSGGDGRINFGLLAVLRSMYAAVSNNRPLYRPDTIQALCSLGQASIDPETGDAYLNEQDRAALKLVGMDKRGGLLMSASHTSHRASFYKEQLAKLATTIAATPKPQLVEVFIDVFGFSRGAAEARVFCNWLEPLFTGEKLAGVTAHVRFLGIFDTVAAVGLGASATGFTDGHQSWGDAPYLRIPARVGHCEHYVAMHENRGAFPLEDAALEGKMPGNVRQYRFPGMHSDVGGGYSPTDQGRGPDSMDAEKLSQIPLDSMFNAAAAAKVPLDKALARQSSGWDCFEVSPKLRDAYEKFLDKNGRGPRALRDCLVDFLAWRYAVRNKYADLDSVKRASADDRDDLVGANRLLVQDADALATVTGSSHGGAGGGRSAYESDPEGRHQELARQRVSAMSQYAKEIYQRITTYRDIDPAESSLFVNYCHDSYAGFKPFDEPVAVGIDLPGSWETEGYLRYRIRFEGNDTRLTQRQLFPDERQAVPV